MEFTVPDKLDANLTIQPSTVAPLAVVSFSLNLLALLVIRTIFMDNL
jgi:hypothetical protein